MKSLGVEFAAQEQSKGLIERTGGLVAKLGGEPDLDLRFCHRNFNAGRWFLNGL